ncbi:unnamed protein product [Merluccius merluccius]
MVIIHVHFTSFWERALPKLTLGSRAQPAGLVEIAVRLSLNQRKELWGPILKPQRPCLRPPAPHRLPSDMLCQQYVAPLMSFLLDDILDDAYYNTMVPIKNKRVVFADSKGLSLTDVRMFSEDRDSFDEHDEHFCHYPSDPLLSPRQLGVILTPDLSGEDAVSGVCCFTANRLQLGFLQPSAGDRDQSMVALESCAVLTEAALLRGTARVKNISFRKDVHVRVTFDSWQSYRDVRCVYVQTRYGSPQTDIFEFDVHIPKVLDPKKKIEFCLRYLPDGHSQPFWDNNDGHNYGVNICVSSHLCQGNAITY